MFIFPYDWVARILSSGRLGMSTIYSIIYLSVRGEQGETKTLFPMVWHVILFSFYLFILQVGANFRMMVCTLSNEKVHLPQLPTTKKNSKIEPRTKNTQTSSRWRHFCVMEMLSKFKSWFVSRCFPEFVRYFMPLVIAQPCSSYGFRVCWHQKKNVMVGACRQSLKFMCGSEVHSFSLIKFRVVFGILRKFVWFWVSRRFFSHESLKSYSCWANQKRFLSLCSAFRSILREGFFFLTSRDNHRTQFIQTTQIKIESLFVPFIK